MPPKSQSRTMAAGKIIQAVSDLGTDATKSKPSARPTAEPRISKPRVGSPGA